MEKTIFVSNRLAVRLVRGERGLEFVRSVGGLATGLSSVAADSGSTVWVGWSGVPDDELSDDERREAARSLRQEHASLSVPLAQADLDEFYSGFCNDTIWPLFHYFPTYAEYSTQTWEAYRRVNRAFFDVVRDEIAAGTRIWVHDYQLLLLPGMIKDRFPDARVGFFLHIPFPSFEVFRLLPWREEILHGMLGADLVGFHTYDYARHFLSSVRRLAGFDHNMGVIQAEKRAVKVDVFPMGIDWQRYARAPELTEVTDITEQVRSAHGDRKLVLSVDRLDYSKGIPGRIRAFGRLLDRHPELRGNVSLIIIVSPSRESVPRYMALKREVDELVSDINGRNSTLDWTPIHYQYQTASFTELCALYRCADVLLVTPLRDGMNLIAKEYLAVRGDEGGVLVISETAGAARELSEALQVNPSDLDGIADAIYEALHLSREDQAASMNAMRARLERLPVQRWARTFLDRLDETRALQASYRAQPITTDVEEEIIERWRTAPRRLLFLDYDGTLMRFFRRPGMARPDEELRGLLERVNALPDTFLVISSGRDRTNLEAWFPDAPFGLGAGHGAWLREPGGEWAAAGAGVPNWKETIGPVIRDTVDRTPGSALEEKDYSLAWHYRDCEPELANVRLAELRDTLLSFTSNLDLSVLDGNRVLEVKPTHIHKGRVVYHFLAKAEWDIVIAIGDDATDEYMFQALPEDAISIKVGVGTTAARYSIDGVGEVRALLARLAG